MGRDGRRNIHLMTKCLCVYVKVGRGQKTRTEQNLERWNKFFMPPKELRVAH